MEGSLGEKLRACNVFVRLNIENAYTLYMNITIIYIYNIDIYVIFIYTYVCSCMCNIHHIYLIHIVYVVNICIYIYTHLIIKDVYMTHMGIYL